MATPYDPFRLGWLVGIIDGEGYIGVRNGRPTVQVMMTDEDTILQLHNWCGLGTVSGPVRPTDHRKPYWKWNITARDDAAWFITQLYPHLSRRRKERADAVLESYRLAGPTRGTAPTCGYGHDITPESGNLRLITDAKGYVRRRCIQCAARRQRDHRARRSTSKIPEP